VKPSLYRVLTSPPFNLLSSFGGSGSGSAYQ
jgi:hypothetical protein